MSEFNLSEKIRNIEWSYNNTGKKDTINAIPTDDVKEFIKELKEKITLEQNKFRENFGRPQPDWISTVIFELQIIKMEIIDQLAGEKLI